MKRHLVFGILLAALFSLWVGLKFSAKKLPTAANWFVDICPFYAIILFGVYCLARLGTDLVAFNDYPEEVRKLGEDIRMAKEDLKKRGFSDHSLSAS